MTDLFKAINDSLEAFVKLLWPLSTAVAGVGIATMAVLQIVKDVLPARRWFQKWWLSGWLRERARATTGNSDKAIQDLLTLTTGGDDKAFFDLPVEQLTGLMNSATQVILDYPTLHADLLWVLAHGAAKADIEKLLKLPAGAGRKRDELSAAERQELTDFVDARNRVTHQIQRTLDAVQIAMGSKWKFLLGLASIVLSGAFMAVAFALFVPGSLLTTRRVTFYVIAAVIGGFLAPVARDLVAALQALRGRLR